MKEPIKIGPDDDDYIWAETDPAMEYLEYVCKDCGKAFRSEGMFPSTEGPTSAAKVYELAGKPLRDAYCGDCESKDIE